MSDDDPIPVAVVGAGNMGTNHIRVYDELPEADLVEVVEPDPERAAEIESKYDVQTIDSVDNINRAVAASIAVPNKLHRETAETLIENGLDVLVEKPLAPSVSDATAIAETAAKHNAILQVGHIERFNPAVELLEEIIADEEVIAIEAHRLGPFNDHLSQESVVYDLMVHDLDIIRTLASSEVQHLNAVGSKSRSQEIDHAIATMQFDSGVLGTLTASHVTHGKVRRLDVTTRNSFIQLKYQKQSLEIQHHGTEQLTRVEEQNRYRTETVTERPFVKTREPLKNELEEFLARTRDRQTPRVSGADGISAIELAETVINSLSRTQSSD